MAKEWTDEEVKAEIAEAVRIVREDKFEAFVRGRMGNAPESGGKPGSAPPPTDPKDPGKETSKRGSLWWGQALEDET